MGMSSYIHQDDADMGMSSLSSPRRLINQQSISNEEDTEFTMNRS
jgi:hypothetical protein